MRTQRGGSGEEVRMEETTGTTARRDNLHITGGGAIVNQKLEGGPVAGEVDGYSQCSVEVPLSKLGSNPTNAQSISLA